MTRVRPGGAWVGLTMLLLLGTGGQDVEALSLLEPDRAPAEGRLQAASASALAVEASPRTGDRARAEVAQLSGVDASAPLGARKDTRPLFALVNGGGALVFGSRVVSTARTGVGSYEVVFDRDVRGVCALTATERAPTVQVCLPDCPLAKTLSVNTERALPPQQPANTVNVWVLDAATTLQDAAFYLVATCP